MQFNCRQYFELHHTSLSLYLNLKPIAKSCDIGLWHGEQTSTNSYTRIVHFVQMGLLNPNSMTHWKKLSVEQCLFGDSFKSWQLAILLYGICLEELCSGQIWLYRNDLVSNQPPWSQQKVESTIWNTLLDYGRIE
jgi:hypothetical protein